MEISEYQNIFENENDHFFYVSTHYLVMELVDKYLRVKKDTKILDAGCGTGGLAKKLSGLGKVSAVDFSPIAIKFAKKNGVPARQASVNNLSFADNSFDLVTCIDVIYHREVDDIKALSEMTRVLKRGGLLILRVPANKFLMSAHDRHVHTARRYGLTELKNKIETAGLKLEILAFVHSPILLLSLIRIVIEKLSRKSSRSAVSKPNRWNNLLLTVTLKAEAWLIVRGIRLPFGQGLIVVATK